MQVRLEVAHQKANVKRVVLKQDAVIGRSAECSLRIASSLVSRQHCKFTISEESVLLRDLGSSNGTFLNGTRLTPETDYEVTPDSQLSVGGVMFMVRFDAPSPPPPPLVATPPGSTVDLPAVPRPKASERKSDELTAEWSAGSTPPALAETATYAGLAAGGASAAVVAARLTEQKASPSEEDEIDGEGATLPPNPEPTEEAEHPTFAEPEFEAEPVALEAASAVENAVEEEEVAELLEAVEDPQPEGVEPVAEEAPGVQPPFLVASEEAARDVVSAHAGDVIDAGLLDSVPAPESPFAFGEAAPEAPAPRAWSVGDSFPESPAVEEAEAAPDEPSPEPAADDSPKKKKKLFSLFGLFGKKNKAEAAEVETSPAAPVVFAGTPASAGPVAAEPLMEELPVAEPVEAIPVDEVTLPVGVEVAEAVPVEEVTEAVEVEAVEPEANAEDASVETADPPAPTNGEGEYDPYDTLSIPVPATPPSTATPSPPPSDDGFGDFLKQIGQ